MIKWHKNIMISKNRYAPSTFVFIHDDLVLFYLQFLVTSYYRIVLDTEPAIMDKFLNLLLLWPLHS